MNDIRHMQITSAMSAQIKKQNIASSQKLLEWGGVLKLILPPNVRILFQFFWPVSNLKNIGDMWLITSQDNLIYFQ